MSYFEEYGYPHRRYNLLSGEWILVSPQRTLRPWTGQLEPMFTEKTPNYHKDCYLCPGNRRSNGQTNPDYTGTFVFTNDFAAILATPPATAITTDRLLRAEAERGTCRVICYSPQHNITLGRLIPEKIVIVINTWVSEYNELSARTYINSIQIFENRGLIMGCSNPHPHGQIWANSCIPTLVERETTEQQKFFATSGDCLLCTYLAREEKEKSRLIFSNDSFAVLVPFWAIWPFETMIIPRFHAPSISSMDSGQKHDLAQAMIHLNNCYDNLFQISFPYSMGIHQQPCDGEDHPEWHWHIHYYPPLLRSQSIKKHMVGYELLAMAQRDITAEEAAKRLRKLIGYHFSEKK